MKEYTLAPVAERFLRVRRKVLRVCLALLRQSSPTIKCAILWGKRIFFSNVYVRLIVLAVICAHFQLEIILELCCDVV